MSPAVNRSLAFPLPASDVDIIYSTSYVVLYVTFHTRCRRCRGQYLTWKPARRLQMPAPNLKQLIFPFSARALRL